MKIISLHYMTNIFKNIKIHNKEFNQDIDDLLKSSMHM